MRPWAAIFLLFTACAPRSEESPEQLYQRAVRLLRQGPVEQALELARQGVRREKSGRFYWQFQLLVPEILLAQGRAAEARELLGTATHAGSQPPPEVETRRRMLLGWAALNLARLEDASAHLEEAGQRASELKAVALSVQIDLFRGQLLARRGRLRESEAAFRNAQRQAVELGDRYQEGLALNNLGMLKLVQSRYDEAVGWFQQARNASRDAGARIAGSLALHNLALCYAQLGDFERAATLRNEAIRLQEQAGVNFQLLRSLGEAGSLYILQDQPAKAVPYYRRALEMARKSQAAAEASRWAGNLASAYAEMEDWDAAARFNEEALHFRPDPRSRDYLKLNSAVIAAGRREFGEAEDLFLKSIRDTGGNPAAQWTAHAGLADLYMKQETPGKANRHYDDAISIIERSWAELRREYKITFLSRLIHFYQSYVDALISQGDRQAALQVADSSRARVLAERMGMSQAGALGTGTSIDYRTASARSRSVFLFYWLAPRRSFLWVVTPRSLEVLLLPPKKEIEDLVAAYRSVIAQLRDPLESDHPAGRRLYELLLASAQPFIPVGSRVVLVPDGALHDLNFETLPIPGTRPRYWLEDVTLTIAPSLSVLLTETNCKPSRRNSLLLIGAPESSGPAYPPLPYAAAEIEGIQQQIPSVESKVYTGPAAHPSVYGIAHPERFSRIHFAAHAEANRQSPLDSAIILSPQADSFKLYARDVLDLPLNAELVTISACRSAGARSYAGEGLVGFAWAFLQAGARNVIAGLWDVADRSTAELMQNLYSELRRGRSPAEALRQSKLSLIRSAAGYRKPYYWAPFQVYVRCSR